MLYHFSNYSFSFPMSKHIHQCNIYFQGNEFLLFPNRAISNLLLFLFNHFNKSLQLITISVHYPYTPTATYFKLHCPFCENSSLKNLMFASKKIRDNILHLDNKRYHNSGRKHNTKHPITQYASKPANIKQAINKQDESSMCSQLSRTPARKPTIRKRIMHQDTSQLKTSALLNRMRPQPQLNQSGSQPPHKRRKRN